MKLPELVKTDYSWYHDKYREQLPQVIYAYLFQERSTNWIDREILHITDRDSRGFHAMAILHHFGFGKAFKGIFKGMDLKAVIAKLSEENDRNADTMIALLENDFEYLNDIQLEGSAVLPDSEGGKKVYYTTRYERSYKNRKLAIKAHGTVCKICGFDFEKVYGERGKDYIEVHHLIPLSEADKEICPDPETDMIVLCSNCHRMIHRKGVITPDELAKIIQTQKATV